MSVKAANELTRKMPTGSSRRKARVPLHITKQEVVEDGAAMDIDDEEEKQMLDVDAPNNTCEARCNGRADDSKIKAEPQLPEGTVVVQPEAVPDNDGDFKGPEFKSRSKSRRSAQKEGLLDSDSDFEEPGFKSRSKSRRSAQKDVIVEMDRVHCTSCNNQVNHLDTRTFKPHPALKVIICRKCFDYYKSGKFTKDDDGIDEQCRWCAEGGSLICCDFCSNVFCKKCIKQNLGRGSLSGLLSEEDSKWNCYVCDPSPLKQLQKICKDVVLGNKLVNESKPSCTRSVTAGKTRLLHPNISRVSVSLQMKPNSPSLEITSEGLRVRNVRPKEGQKPALKMALWLMRNLQQTAETAKEEIKKVLLSKSSIGSILKGDKEVQSDENKKWLSLKFDIGKPATPRHQTSKAQKSSSSKQNIKSETSSTEVSSSAAAATAPSGSDDNHLYTNEQNGKDVENMEMSTTSTADIPSSAACSSSGEGALDTVLAESDDEKSKKTEMECDRDETDKIDAEAKNVGQSVETVTENNDAKTHEDQNKDEKSEKMESDDENRKEMKETSSKENDEKAKDGSEEPQDGENDGNDKTETQENPKKRSQQDIECEQALMDEIEEMPDRSDKECATPKKQTTKPVVITPLRIKLQKISPSKLKEATHEKHKSLRRQKTTPKSPRSSSDNKHVPRSNDSEDASEAKSEAPKSKVSKDVFSDEKESDNSALSGSDDVDSSTLEDVDWKSRPRRSLRRQKDTDVDNDKDNTKKLNKKANKKESKKQKDSDSDAEVPKGSEKKKTKEKHSGPGKDSSNLEEDSDEVERLITPKKLKSLSRRSIRLKQTPKSSPKSKIKSKSEVRESDSSNFDSDLEREINNLTKAPSKTKRRKQDEGENEGCESADDEGGDEGGDEVSKQTESTLTKDEDKNARDKKKAKSSKETKASTDSSSDSEPEAQGSDDSQDCEDAQTLSNGDPSKDEMGREKLTAEDALDSDLENKLAEQQLMDEIENELDKEDTDDGESGSEDSSESDLPKKTKPKTKKKSLEENGSENGEDNGKDDDDDDDEYKGEKEEDEDESSEYQESSHDEKPSKKKQGRRHRLMRVKLGESSSSNDGKDTDASDSASKKTHKSKKGKKRGHGSCSTSDSDVFKNKSKKGAKRGRRRRSSSGSEHSSNEFQKDRSYNRGKGKGKKRRRIKVASDSNSEVEKKKGSGSSDSEKESPNKHGRKKIRRLISRDRLKDETVRAAKEEKERRKRIEEKRTTVTEVSEEAAESMGTVDEIILERDSKTKEVVLSVMDSLAKQLKPHQVEGVQFIWDCTYESIEKIEEKGSGCILAHCMGLGKTLQVITFLHTVMTNEKISVVHALVVAPLNTVLNWVTEFEKWLGKDSEIEVFEITSYKNNWQRADALKYWHENGGVMVMGYSMYRQLSMHKFVKNKKQRTIFTQALVDPGPDIVVCDEGHMLKNDASAISKALNSIKTLRRICLTGTPLQNNLIEYHCMVDFVKPNLLGTRREFLNRFVNPITNGQCADSTPKDVKIMKRRAHVLHDMLNGCVQRKDYGALTKFLPPKYEYVISVRLSPVQVKLYELYLQSQSRNDSGQVIEGSSKGSGAGLFADYQQLMQIWTHPQVLKLSEIRYEKAQSRNYLSDFITSESEESEVYDNSDSVQEYVVDNSEPEEITMNEEDMPSTSFNTGTRRTRLQENAAKQEQERDKPEKKKPSREGGDSDSSLEVIKTWKTRSRCRDPSRENVTRTPSPTGQTAKPKWYDEFIQEGDDTKIELSGKLVILFDVLKHAESIGEKVLVFSQSLLSLDLIEDMLQSLEDRAQVEREEGSQDLNNQIGGVGSWIKGEDYFRMDGSTSAALRKTWAEIFNDMNNYRARLFLISTKAGSLGTNLIGANRVIIFDASWNPSHDIQSIFRVYRFGQTRAVYVYRLVAQGTMEEKIYERQVTKQSLSCRVVDEHQIERHFTSSALSELYTFTPDRLDDPNRPERETPVLPKDYVLAEMLKINDKWIVTYHEHDSLLENIESEELTEEERKNAWKEYDDEKEGRIRMTIDPRLLVTQGMNQQDLAKLQGIYGQASPQMAQLVGNQPQYILPNMGSPGMTQASLMEQLALSGSSSQQQMQKMIMYQRYHMQQQIQKAQQAQVLQQQQQQQQEQQQLATMRKTYYMDGLIARPKSSTQLAPKTQVSEAQGESIMQGLNQAAKPASQGGRSSDKSGT